MGVGMAHRLLDGQHELRVFNRTAERADDLVAQGARWFATPREACEGGEAVVCMLADDEASRAVWHGPDGALAANLAPRALAIECSTLSHDWVLELAATAASKQLRYVDAPVTGLPESAAAGELTLLVGAPREHLDAARPLLARFSERILHFGPIGTGTVYKLLVNMLGAVSAELYRQLCALGPEHVNESKIIDVARAQPPARD